MNLCVLKCSCGYLCGLVFLMIASMIVWVMCLRVIMFKVCAILSVHASLYVSDCVNMCMVVCLYVFVSVCAIACVVCVSLCFQNEIFRNINSCPKGNESFGRVLMRNSLST